MKTAVCLGLNQATRPLLRHHVLSRMVVGDRERAEELYAVLLRRGEGAEAHRVPELEYRLRALADGRAAGSQRP